MFARSHLALAVLLALAGCPAFAEVAPGTYSIPSDVSGGVQNLRAGPGQGHRIVVGVPAGSSGVQIGECRSADDGRSRYDWCRASWNGHSGWISSCCLDRQTATAPTSSNPSQSKSRFEICVDQNQACHRECGKFFMPDFSAARQCGQENCGSTYDKCRPLLGLD